MLNDHNLHLQSRALGKFFVKMGGSPGLVVTGGDSCSEGRGQCDQIKITKCLQKLPKMISLQK